MKLFLLRHEQRPEKTGFYTELTEQGKKNSNNKIEILENMNIIKFFVVHL